MQDLQAAFLRDAPRRIQNLREDLFRLANSNSLEQPELIRKLFRQFHTLKGSAAAFNLSAVSRIAHQLEDFLEIINPDNFADSVRVLENGIVDIEAALCFVKNGSAQPDSEQKIKELRTRYDKSRNDDKAQSSLPFDLEKKLNFKEIEQLRQALKFYSSLAILRVGFPLLSFADDFIRVRSQLNNLGEIVATLPDSEKTTATRIALQLIFVCNETTDERICSALNGIDTETAAFYARQGINDKDFSLTTKKFKLSDLWAQASLAGKQTALKQGKKIEFLIRGSSEIEIGEKFAEACETAFLHIARNAAAHGIETPELRRRNGKSECGIVCLEVCQESNFLCLQIFDDGNGIDWEKVWRLARERKLIAENAKFDWKEAGKIIFQPGFSTADAVTEDAGRGVGLDAVQTAICEAGGTIEASSETGRGTKFSIRFDLSLKSEAETL
jgi:chemotaxis protein histidine kinase CheA